MTISNEEFNKLKKVCENGKLKFRKSDLNSKKCMDFDEFFNRPVKGSKRYRTILAHSSNPYQDAVPHNMIKFADSFDILIDLENSKKLNSFWNKSFLSNACRTWLFKFYNNTVGYNAMVSHFVRGHSDNCTFCDILLVPEQNRETGIHLFYQCTITENVTNRVFSHYMEVNTIPTRQELLVGFNTFSHQKNSALNLISKLYLKFLWDCKVRKCLPTPEGAIQMINYELKTICKISTETRLTFLGSGIDTDRDLVE